MQENNNSVKRMLQMLEEKRVNEWSPQLEQQDAPTIVFGYTLQEYFSYYNITNGYGDCSLEFIAYRWMQSMAWV